MPDLIPVDEKAAALIHEMLPEFQNVLNRALICQAFLASRDKNGTLRFYVNRTGLLIFMEKKFRTRKTRYSIRVEPLKEDEELRLRHNLRLENEPFVALKGIVEVVYEDGTREVFEDIGTASPRDCHHGRLVEMAATRATNRAMRLATSLGFTSVEELPEESRQEDKPQVKEPEERNNEALDKATEKQLKMIHVLINELAKATESPRDEIVKEIKERYKVQHSDQLTKQQASELIEELQQQLAAIKEGNQNG